MSVGGVGEMCEVWPGQECGWGAGRTRQELGPGDGGFGLCKGGKAAHVYNHSRLSSSP